MTILIDFEFKEKIRKSNTKKKNHVQYSFCNQHKKEKEKEKKEKKEKKPQDHFQVIKKGD